MVPIWYHSLMNLIARSTDYAIRALIYIAQSKNKLVSTAELDEQLKLPRPFMRRILQQLQKEGILNSVKGNKGGFALAKDSKDIFLEELMHTFQGDINFATCLFKKKLCACVDGCPLRRKVKKIEKMVIDELQGVTLQSMMEE